MPGWNSKRFAAYGLVLGLAGLSAGLQTACHKSSKPDNLTQPPVVELAIPDSLATQGAPFASVTPKIQAFVYTEGVGSWVTSGFHFSVLPALPDGLSLNATTGQITGTPTATGNLVPYTISANNSISGGQGGTATFIVRLGVQPTSPVTLDYAGTGAVSTSVGGSITLNPPAVAGGTPSGFGVSPALPAGVILNPDNGLISGSPTVVGGNPSGNYLLTVTTALPDGTPTGSANAPFILLVAPALPVLAAPGPLAYPAGVDTSTPIVLTVNAAMIPLDPTPAVTGSSVVYTVLPALPAGLALDPSTGRLSGTPTTAAGQTLYTVTASNPWGNSPTSVYLTVN